MSISFHTCHRLGKPCVQWQGECIADTVQLLPRSEIMRHPNLMRTIGMQVVVRPAVVVGLILSACAEQPPTGPKVPSVAVKNVNVPFNQFFTAWSQNYYSSPIRTQMFALDTRLLRQYTGFYADQSVLDFAAAHPGQIYINGDEPDQSCITPYDYAGIFHDFVAAVRAVDPTARFSNGGFADPNDQCTPTPGEPYRSSMHYTSYATDFYSAYVQRYGVAPPVSEWRFHNFAQWLGVGDLTTWWSQVNAAAAWSLSHGANMVLGSWGFIGWNEPTSDYQEHLKRAMGLLMNDTRINEAVYWSYELWGGFPHYLANSDGSLTAEGQTYANPLTDIPTGVTTAGSAGAHARLQWTNTTAAWSVEAEFWVQPGGFGSYVYDHSDFVSPGGTRTPDDQFNLGDRVKGRVRYYNVYGQAAFSPFSNIVLMH
jgi:hypothetical protein